MRVNRRAGFAANLATAIVAAAAVASCAGPAAPATPFPSLGPDAVVFAAKGTQYTTQDVHVPADQAWTVAFDNQDNLPHNVVILAQDDKAVFTGTLVTGPKLYLESAPPLAAGQYHFTCTVHPEMHGALTVP